MTDPQHEVFTVHLEYLREKMDEVVAHLQRQNGKLEAHGQRLAVLEDRGSDTRNTALRWGAGISAIITGLVTALSHLFGGGK